MHDPTPTEIDEVRRRLARLMTDQTEVPVWLRLRIFSFLVRLGGYMR